MSIEALGGATESSAPYRFAPRDVEAVRSALAGPQCDLLIVPRDEPTLAAIEFDGAEIGEARRQLRPRSARRGLAALLGALRMEHDALLADLQRSLEFFCEAFDQTGAEVRVELTDRCSCPKFHCDNVYVRMLTTYRGPTTEYVDLNRPSQVHSAPLQSLVFLKGSRHPTHAHAIHHRSPDVPAGRLRFCAVFNCLGWLPSQSAGREQAV